jgi:ubiquinone biosynthesis protein
MPIIFPGKNNRISNALLDFRRAIFLCWVVLKFISIYIYAKIFHLSSGKINYGARLRRSLEQLGLTYLKLGQFLALRFDLLPKEVLVEMNNLFENVQSVPFEKIKSQIEKELKRPLEELYLVFHQKPVGAATVAQVHQAITFGNEKVAVKVQRPGIELIFNADIRNLRRLARLADFFKLGGAFVMAEVVDEFDKWTSRELSFTTEANTAERLRLNALPYEIIPAIYKELSTDKVITMEFIEGLSLAKIIDLNEENGFDAVKARLPDLDLGIIGHRLANAVLRQLFVTGFFHGDPHPGNIFIRNDNTVAFLDFGIFGEMTDEQMEILSGHLENIALGNINESFRYYAMQYQPTEETDIRQFEKEGREVLSQWYQVSNNPYSRNEDKHLGKVGADMFEVIRRNKLKGSTSVLLFWRALYALDVSALKLGDYFDLMAEMKAFFIRIRPGLTERMIGIATNKDRNIAIGQLTFGWPNYLNNALYHFAEKAPVQQIKNQYSPSAQKVFTSELKWLFWGLAILTSVIIIIRLYPAIPIQFFAVLLVASSLFFLVFNLNSLADIFSSRKRL